MPKFYFIKDDDYEEIFELNEFFANGFYSEDSIYHLDFNGLNNYLEFRYGSDFNSLIDFKVKNNGHYKQHLIKLFLDESSSIPIFLLEPTSYFTKITIAVSANESVRVYRENSLVLSSVAAFKGIHIGDGFDGILKIKDLRFFKYINSPLRIPT